MKPDKIANLKREIRTLHGKLDFELKENKRLKARLKFVEEENRALHKELSKRQKQ